jgi:hypothetical protein
MTQQFFEGANSEKLFCSLALKNNWKIASVSQEVNMKHHVDFIISKNNLQFKVDVKAQKRLSRRMSVQDEWIAIEFVGVSYPRTNIIQFSNTPFNPANPNFLLGSGKKGWIYGEADIIAFEMNSHFLLVDKQRLLQHCIEKINFATRVHASALAKYHVFSRPDRGDLISFINKKDLYHLVFAKWYKPIVLSINT